MSINNSSATEAMATAVSADNAKAIELDVAGFAGILTFSTAIYARLSIGHPYVFAIRARTIRMRTDY